MESYFVHESSYIDIDVEIGDGTKIWHFCHIQKGARIGKRCSLGQNVNISNNVVMGDECKIQNNVSLYEGVELEGGVFCGPSCVFTNDLTPRARYPKGRAHYKRTLIKEGASQCNHCLRAYDWKICHGGGRGSGYERCARLRTGGWSAGHSDWESG